MSDDTEEEGFFRRRYAQELEKKKQQNSDSYRGYDELVDERRKVNQPSSLIGRSIFSPLDHDRQKKYGTISRGFGKGCPRPRSEQR